MGLLEGALRLKLGVECLPPLNHMIAQSSIFLHLIHLTFTTFIGCCLAMLDIEANAFVSVERALSLVTTAESYKEILVQNTSGLYQVYGRFQCENPLRCLGLNLGTPTLLSKVLYHH